MSRRLTGFAVLILACATLSAKNKTGFDGKWAIEKDSQGDEPLPLELIQNIKQKDTDVDIETTFAEPQNGVVPLLYVGIMTSRLDLSTDGSERQNQIGPFQQASKTTVDGNTMTTEWTAVIKGDNVNGKWVRTLDPDGKHMTLQINESSKGQDHQATLKFRRK